MSSPAVLGTGDDALNVSLLLDHLTNEFLEPFCALCFAKNEIKSCF